MRVGAARTWGLDLSTNVRNIGLVKVDWSSGTSGRVSIERLASIDGAPPRSITEYLGVLAAYIETTVAGGDWWAVDVPFGWPHDSAHG